MCSNDRPCGFALQPQFSSKSSVTGNGPTVHGVTGIVVSTKRALLLLKILGRIRGMLLQVIVEFDT